MRLEIAPESVADLAKLEQPQDTKYPTLRLRGYINLYSSSDENGFAPNEINFGVVTVKINGLTDSTKAQIEAVLNNLSENRICHLTLNKTNNRAHIIVPDAPQHQSSLGIAGEA